MKRKAKKRAGRPALEGGRVKFTTTLPADTIMYLRNLGGNNVSRAIIELVDEHRARSLR